MSDKPAKNEPEKPLGPPMTDAERTELNDRLTRMVTRPTRSEMIPGRPFLLWSARDDSGGAGVVVWNPETPEELRGAALFYDAAHGLNDFAKPVKAGEPTRRTPEHEAFIKGILANREDHTAYLAYADYLTEHGDSQGDYIRACVQLSRLTPHHPDFERLNRETGDMLDAHAEEWLAPLGELGLRPETLGFFSPYAWISLERGVIEVVTIDRSGLLPQHADRLFAAAPFLRKLKFEKGHLDPAGLAKVKQLAQIEELDLWLTELTADGLRTLLRSKHLTGLRSFPLGTNQFGDGGATALAAWPGLAKLESLEVSQCSLTAAGVQAICGSKGVANLKRLRIGRNENTDETVEAVLGSPRLKNLTELEFGGMQFTPVTAAGFRTAAFAKKLRNLDLDGATFQPGGFAEFTRCALPSLSQLKLNSIRISAMDTANLANAIWRETLTDLSLDVCQLGGAGVEALAEGDFPKLSRLELSRNGIGTRGGVALANAAANFPALTYLRMWDDNLTPAAVGHLADSPILANLTSLDLTANKIGPAGAQALAKSKRLKKLTSLIVDEATVGKKGKQLLLDRFGESVVSFR